MNINQISLFYIFLMTFLLSCSDKANSEKIAELTNIPVATDSLRQDTLELKESFREEDIPVNEYMSETLQPIRANFKSINSITEWTSIQQRDLKDASEGGTATNYLLKGQLQKIIVHRFGEMGKQISEYYLMDEQLSFVFEKSYQYNRPMYYDSVASQENHDQAVFDPDETEMIEVRSYFENGQLLHQLHSMDCGAPFSTDYLIEEQKRILADYQQLLDLKQ